MNIVLFSPEEIGRPLNTDDPRARHILDILHKKQGDFFEAGIENGQAGTAEITSVTKAGISFRFEPHSSGKPLHPLTMIIGFPRPIQLKRLLRDIASLGVQEVHLVGTELGEKSYLKSTLAEHSAAYGMLKDGSVQAKSTHIPELFIHASLAECLACSAISAKEDSIRIALDNVQPECPILLQGELAELSTAELGQRGVLAAIGSERGWTDTERDLFRSHGFSLCSMGERVLRTETASTVAAALILSKLGAI